MYNIIICLSLIIICQDGQKDYYVLLIPMQSIMEWQRGYQKVVVESKLAEVMAALHVVMFCKEASFLNVVFEGNAL
jgi:hypothetical protein